jgi:hypothetical protein
MAGSDGQQAHSAEPVARVVPGAGITAGAPRLQMSNSGSGLGADLDESILIEPAMLQTFKMIIKSDVVGCGCRSELTATITTVVSR